MRKRRTPLPDNLAREKRLELKSLRRNLRHRPDEPIPPELLEELDELL